MPRWVRADGVLWRHSLGELVALGDGEPVKLNSTCAVLWEHLTEPATTGEIIAILAERFEAEPAAIGEDVAAILGHLAKQGLVTTQ